MGQHLLLTVRIHGDGLGIARFHGMSLGGPEWPPAPARVFQALVAGVARGSALPTPIVSALEWLETLAPPVIGAPRRILGQSVALYVPNNDADSLSDPRDVSSIRTKKAVQPSLFSDEVPFIYAWKIADEGRFAKLLIEAADDFYQLGRGIDLAWASGEVLDDDSLDARFSAYQGVLHEPEVGVRGDKVLSCPVMGTLKSLQQRHASARFRFEGARGLFVNAPKPHFLNVAYGRARRLTMFDLRDAQDTPWPWALGRVVQLIEAVRDGAAARLREGLVGKDAEVERALIGRKADGRDAGPSTDRVRIVPLPSIGSEWADHAVRRVVLEVPSGAELDAHDVEWALAGLRLSGDGRVSVVRTDDRDMLRHFVASARRWRSVTAVALPESAKRRRIEPSRRREEAKTGSERSAEETRAVEAVRDALRHAGVRGTAVAVRVQREPFGARGARAQLFAKDTRFAKERLWHVEISFDRDVSGPLVIGDGRFLGLGVMAPVADATSGVLAFSVIGEVKDRPDELARALRRAVMARVQASLGETAALSRYFTGHEEGGAKAEGGHLAFHWDSSTAHLLVLAPHVLDRREPTGDERRNFAKLVASLEGFEELRAGPVGRFGVRRDLSPVEPLLNPSRRWISATPYTVTRHLKKTAAAEVLERDVLRECARCGLPRPRVAVGEMHGVPGRGLEGTVELEFSVAVAGPIVMGRTRYLGGGLFRTQGRVTNLIA